MKGRQADVVLAAYTAAEVALRLVRPGTEVRISVSSLSTVVRNLFS